MKTFVSVIVFLSLFIALSCEVPSSLEKPVDSPRRSLPNARTTSFVNSDLLYQWRMVWVDLDTYGWHTSSNDACLVSNWVYFGQPDVTNGDVIEGTWSTTNWSCGDAHTGQQLLDSWGSPYSVAFEEWNSIATMPQRYSFNKATGDITLYRNVSLGSSLYKELHMSLATDKQSANLYTMAGATTFIRIERATGGPSVP